MITKWTPFRLAARLRCLQQGSLNVGNTHQNLTNLANLAVAQANLLPGGSGWAKWRAGWGPSGTSTAGILLNVPAVPGYVAPVGAPGEI